MDEKPSDVLTGQPRRLRTALITSAFVLGVSGLGVGGYAVAQTLTQPTAEVVVVDQVADEPTPEPTPNVAPTANFLVTAISGLTVTIDGSPSGDADGTVDAYAWDFGDGATAAGVNVSHAYAAYGTYTITLTVTDSDAATAAVSATIDVVAAPPPPPPAQGGPVRCPAGSFAQENDGVNDVWCMWDYCANLTLPSAEHPECYPFFKP
jgi:chitodextrinase